MKVISMYLPQFHRVKENDEWWGEGFTEWTTVKKAEEMYPGHYQPRIPFNENYYDLLEKTTMKWQAELMKQYGIDGQCIYHYWFKDGRQILEKPAQNLLQWKEIDMPFLFCWANETWARTWSRISAKNPWANKFENEQDRKGSGILLEQQYGEENQWKQHFDYLLPFFLDNRYIKKEGKPVFVIYKPALINCLNEMLGKWREWAVEAGFPGLYIIGTDTNSKGVDNLDTVLYHEPAHAIETLKYKRNENCGIFKIEYEHIWNEILNSYSLKENIIYGGFVDYDDTPRRGREGSVVINASPEQFKYYLTELLAKNGAKDNDMIFLNAWNEWGEGMYLEPDQKYGYGYLEAVKYAKQNYKGLIDKYKKNEEKCDSLLKNEIEFWTHKCSRYEEYWRILDKWLFLREENLCIEKYLQEKNINSIAIYGMGMLGKHLLKELEKSKIRIDYAIDQKGDALHMDVKMYTMSDFLPKTDGIIVTATYAFEEIKRQLLERGCQNVISLEQIIMEMGAS